MACGCSSAIALATVLVIPAEIPTFRIMAGKCAWSCGLVFCSCTGFDTPFQELLAEKLPSTECPYCHHPLSNHGELKSPFTTSQNVGLESVQESMNHKKKGKILFRLLYGVTKRYHDKQTMSFISSVIAQKQ